MSESKVIARKFRPGTFDQVVGQEAITRTLSNTIKNDRLHHAYLFTGARGVGKTTTARILAKALNCVNGITVEPCGRCASCQEIAASRSIDVLEIDAASHTQVDNIRSVILQSIDIAPARDRFKIFIIDEVHQLSNHAFNALLKTLEEPPPRVVFIMATTEMHKVPETILSRCQVFEFRTITVKKIFEQLRAIAENLGVKVSDSALLSIARAGEGSMRDAESALDQVISFAGNEVTDEDVTAALGLVDIETLNRTFQAIAREDSQTVLRIVDDVVSRGSDLRNFCRDMMIHARALMVSKVAGFDQELLQMPPGEGEALIRTAEPFSEQDLLRFFSLLVKTEQDIRTSSQPRFQLEIGLIKLVHARRLHLLEDALSRISDLEARLAGAASLPSGSTPPARPAPSREAQASKPPAKPAGLAQAPRPVEESRPRAARPPVGEAVPPQPVAPEPKFERIPPRPPARKAEAAPEPSPSEPPDFGEPFDADHGAHDQGAGVEDIGEKLKRLLEARNKMLLSIAVENADNISVEGDVLRITFSQQYAADKNKLEVRDNRRTIEELGRQIAGRPLSVLLEIEGQPRTAEPPEKREQRSIKEEAEKDPVVRAFVEKFHGEIVEVLKPEN